MTSEREEMSKSKNKLIVEIILSGFKESPDEISRELSVNFDECTTAGKARNNSKIICKENTWSLRSEDDDCLLLEKQVEEVIKKIPDKNKFARYSDKYDGRLVITCYMMDRSHELYLPRALVEEINLLKLAIDIDHYLVR